MKTKESIASNVLTVRTRAWCVEDPILDSLVMFASLRDHRSGAYTQSRLKTVVAKELLDELLREEHQRSFQSWLNLSLEEQVRDMKKYLAEHPERKRDSLRDWMRILPSNALKDERDLFRSNLGQVLQILLS